MAENRIRGKQLHPPRNPIAIRDCGLRVHGRLTGTHLGNAIILSDIPFGDYEASPWTWSMFAKLTGMTVQELKERFPAEANMKNPSACAMYLYEIKPISDKELLQHLCDE